MGQRRDALGSVSYSNNSDGLQWSGDTEGALTAIGLRSREY